MAARGLGAIIGPFVGRSWLAVRDRRIFIEIGLALAVLGVGYVLLGVVPSLVLALPVLVLAQMGGGTLWTLASYGLQVVVPDELRGRLFALDAMVETLTLGVSSLVAGWLAGVIGIRTTATALGVIAIVWAAGWLLLTKVVRQRTLKSGLKAPQRPSAGS
jgi:MFS family permease